MLSTAHFLVLPFGQKVGPPWSPECPHRAPVSIFAPDQRCSLSVVFDTFAYSLVAEWFALNPIFEGSTSQYRPIKPVQAALIIDFRARGHTAPDCACAMLTAVYETMLRLKATSLRHKLGTVGGDAGTGQT